MSGVAIAPAVVTGALALISLMTGSAIERELHRVAQRRLDPLGEHPQARRRELRHAIADGCGSPVCR
jgi:hypothetical protein